MDGELCDGHWPVQEGKILLDLTQGTDSRLQPAGKSTQAPIFQIEFCWNVASRPVHTLSVAVFTPQSLADQMWQRLHGPQRLFVL